MIIAALIEKYGRAQGLTVNEDEGKILEWPEELGNKPTKAQITVAVNQYQAGQGRRDWQRQIDDSEIDNHLENVISGMSEGDRNNIPAETLDKYNDKRALRGNEPA